MTDKEPEPTAETRYNSERGVSLKGGNAAFIGELLNGQLHPRSVLVLL